MTTTMLTTSTQGLHQHHGQHQKQGQPIDENAAPPALRGELNNDSSLGRSISPDRQPEETAPLLEDDGADGRIGSLSRELMAQLDCAACLEGDKHRVRQRRQQQQQDQEEEEEEEDMEERQEKKGKEGTTAATSMFHRATPSHAVMMMNGPFAEAFEGAMALSKRMENSTKEAFANACTVALQNQAAVEGEWTKIASALQHSNITLTADKARIAECNSNLEAKQIVLEKKIQSLETTAAAEKAERDRVASEAKEPWEASPPGRTSTNKIFDNSRTATQRVASSSNALASACAAPIPVATTTTPTTEATTTTKTADAATAMGTATPTTAQQAVEKSNGCKPKDVVGVKGRASSPSAGPSVLAFLADIAASADRLATTATTTAVAANAQPDDLSAPSSLAMLASFAAATEPLRAETKTTDKTTTTTAELPSTERRSLVTPTTAATTTAPTTSTASAVTTADPTSSAAVDPPSMGDFPGVTAQQGQTEPTMTTMPSSSPCAFSVRASVADMAESLPLAASTTTTTTIPALATATAAASTPSPSPAATTAPAPTPPPAPAATIAAAPTPPSAPAATTTPAPTPPPALATTTTAAPTPDLTRDATTTVAATPLAASAAAPTASAAFTANPKRISLNGKENETPQHCRDGKASAGKTGGRPRWVGDGVGSAVVSPPVVSSVEGRTSTQKFSPSVGRAPLGTVSINTTPRSVLADRPRRRKAVACVGTPSLKLIDGISWLGGFDGFGGGSGVSRASVTRPKDGGVVSIQGEGAKESRKASITRATLSSKAAARPTAIVATETAVSVKRSSTRRQLVDNEKTDGMARRLRSSTGPIKQAAPAVIAGGQKKMLITGAGVASRTRQAPTTRGGKVVRKQWV